MKSGPGRSTMRLGAKPSVIVPPLPSVTTSVEPTLAPPPLGGPSAMSGKSLCPVVGPGPAVNDSTEVAKREAHSAPLESLPAAPAAPPSGVAPALPPTALPLSELAAPPPLSTPESASAERPALAALPASDSPLSCDTEPHAAQKTKPANAATV